MQNLVTLTKMLGGPWSSLVWRMAASEFLSKPTGQMFSWSEESCEFILSMTLY